MYSCIHKEKKTGFSVSAAVCSLWGRVWDLAVHRPNNKHLFDRGVSSIAAVKCPNFWPCAPFLFFWVCFFASIHAHERGNHASCPLSVCIIQSLAENHYSEKQQRFGTMTQYVCVPSFVQTAYKCFSGTRKCGSGDMIPMDELGPGKSQTACSSSANEELALL